MVEKRFNLTKNFTVKAFVGCEFDWHEYLVILHQTGMIDKLLEAFSEEITNMKNYKTPEIAGVGIEKAQEQDAKLSENMQKNTNLEWVH